MDSTWSLVSNVISVIILFGVTVWVYVDAKAISSDYGQTPGLVKTQPKLWAVGVFLLLIVCLPAYFLMRVRYKRLLVQRRAELALLDPLPLENPAETAGVWPPPPQQPAA
ncbi:MAG: hypothetical protein ACRYFS_16105 [Janthinobacterium lividum]